MTPVYITHTSAISPQHQNAGNLLQPFLLPQQCCLKVVEPDYTTVIPPMQLRRMSRVLRMGVYAGMDCIRKAGIDRPDGIITGTGKGSMTDTEKFVKELKEYQEEALNPTPFIMSTYNAINGAIALQTKATGYNQTFVHRGSSLEVSLYDAQLKLNGQKQSQNYLVGCFDEITPEYYFIKDKIGYWKKDRETNENLLRQQDTPGTWAGEGAAFFMLSNKADHAIVALHNITMAYQLEVDDLSEWLSGDMKKVGWSYDDIDLLVLGLNGDQNDEPFYLKMLEEVGGNLPVLGFKHLCGEYETSGGFAIWLTCQLLSGEPLPDQVWYSETRLTGKPKKILYYNHYRRLNHNLMLLSSS